MKLNHYIIYYSNFLALESRFLAEHSELLKPIILLYNQDERISCQISSFKKSLETIMILQGTFGEKLVKGFSMYDL